MKRMRRTEVFMPEPLAGMKIVIDPGQVDQMAASKGDIIESQLRFAISRQVSKQLERVVARKW